MRHLATFTLSLALLAGCQADDEPVADEAAPSGWELTPNQARLTTHIAEPNATLAISDKERLDLARQAELDATWYAADGARYEALYVSPSGVTYGRRGPARNWPAPDAEVGEGSLGFLPDSAAPVDEFGAGVGKARIYLNWSDDRRTRQDDFDQLRSVPHRMVGNMSSVSMSPDDGACTGTKIGPRAVLTAAHCVMTSKGSIQGFGWYNPGQSNIHALNGQFQWSGVYLRDYRLDWANDYAVVFLPDSEAAVGLGWMGVAYWNSAADYEGRGATLLGYPCGPGRACGQVDEQRCGDSSLSDHRCDGWMYGHSSDLWDNSYRNDGLLQFDNDASSGQSGSSLYTKLSANDRRVMAVVSHSANGVMRGARFRASMWNDVCDWIAAITSQYGSHGTCN